MIHVDLHCDTLGTHLLQIFSGLYLLQQQGKITLAVKGGLPLTLARPNRQFLVLRVAQNKASRDRTTFLFDLQDSPVLGLPDALNQVDFYVKRSLEPSSFHGLSEVQAKKLIPFGLNYQVVSFSASYFLKIAAAEFFARPYSPLNKKHNFHVHNLKDIFDFVVRGKKNNLLSEKELSPSIRAAGNNSVMFQCRLWEPMGLAEKNQEDANQVNQSRIELIRALKAELGERFWGGLQNTAYARELAPELIANLPSVRREYITRVRKASIVISSVGLLQSNGWKLGEYVALGKCILSEPIATQLPGDFVANKNYIAYESAGNCLDIVKSLLDDEALIASIETGNCRYAQDYLAPDKLIKNVLERVNSK